MVCHGYQSQRARRADAGDGAAGSSIQRFLVRFRRARHQPGRHNARISRKLANCARRSRRFRLATTWIRGILGCGASTWAASVARSGGRPTRGSRRFAVDDAYDDPRDMVQIRGEEIRAYVSTFRSAVFRFRFPDAELLVSAASLPRLGASWHTPRESPSYLFSPMIVPASPMKRCSFSSGARAQTDGARPAELSRHVRRRPQELRKSDREFLPAKYPAGGCSLARRACDGTGMTGRRQSRLHLLDVASEPAELLDLFESAAWSARSGSRIGRRPFRSSRPR